MFVLDATRDLMLIIIGEEQIDLSACPKVTGANPNTNNDSGKNHDQSCGSDHNITINDNNTIIVNDKTDQNGPVSDAIVSYEEIDVVDHCENLTIEAITELDDKTESSNNDIRDIDK